MQISIRTILLVICYFTVTSFAIQSEDKYVVMTNSSLTQVCSIDPPSQVFPMYPGTVIQCGRKCLASSCLYYQLKTSTPNQCELYNQFPMTTRSISNCIGYRLSAIGFPADCSFPFTSNGVLYTGCVPGVSCSTVNLTSTRVCTYSTVAGVINDIWNTGGQSVPVQSIFGWIIWMSRVASVTYDWSLPWASYKSGFGSVGDSNYWLGLERLYQLTSSSKYRLRIEIKEQPTGKWYSVEYWSFTVGDETSTKYTLNVDGFSGDAGNGMQYVNSAGCLSKEFANGMKFTTKDADNDNNSEGNCALPVMADGGWWHNACIISCLTCGLATNYGYLFNWLSTGSGCSVHTLAEARMLMKLQ